MRPARIVYCGTGWLDVVTAIRRALEREGVTAEVVVRDPSRSLAPQLEGADVVLPSHAPIGAAELDAAGTVRLIQQPAVGYENVDLAAARARGIPVCNAPGMNADAVAQASLLLLLALARRWPRAQRALARAEVGSPAGIELGGRRIAIVGFGKSGRRLAAAVEALGMEVVAVGREGGRAALLEALSRVDAVALHAPLTQATRGMIDDEALAAMRPGARLGHVARGGLIDRSALDRALARGRLGGVGLDVFWEEPWDPRDPLFARDDVVALPHVAGSTEESFARIATVVARNVAALVRGEPLLHRVD